MLAQGGKKMTTDRTAIRRRLAVRRTSHGPPWRGRKGHRSIVAPLAATLAASVAVGVGVALARGGRSPRVASARKRERDFALQPGERLAVGLQRIAIGQTDLAIELLGGGGGPVDEHAVHETRKALKRLRALLRLLREDLGEQSFARENDALRDIGARLAGARDSEVMLATLQGLIERHPRKLGKRRGVGELRERLVAEHEREAARTLGQEATRASVLEDLRAFRMRMSCLRLEDRDGIQLIEPGLARVYGQGRSRYRHAAHAKGERGRALHLWRKRVKDLRHAAEMLQRRRAPSLLPAAARRRRDRASRKQAARLRTVARRADELGEMLGEEHDLAMLEDAVRAERGGSAAGSTKLRRGTRRLLLRLIARRRKELRKRSLAAGERLYGRSTRSFVRRMRVAYVRGSGLS
jgi:hypothetical protein